MMAGVWELKRCVIFVIKIQHAQRALANCKSTMPSEDLLHGTALKTQMRDLAL
jgi:hypothetical protein